MLVLSSLKIIFVFKSRESQGRRVIGATAGWARGGSHGGFCRPMITNPKFASCFTYYYMESKKDTKF